MFTNLPNHALKSPTNAKATQNEKELSMFAYSLLSKRIPYSHTEKAQSLVSFDYTRIDNAFKIIST